MKRFVIFFCIFCSLCFCLTGCAGEEETKTFPYQLWYLEESGTALASSGLELDFRDTKGLIDEMITAMQTTPESGKALLDSDIQIQSYQLDGQSLTVDMSPEYGNLDKAEEILVRAGIVRNLIQIEDVSRVAFTVNGEKLKDSNGSSYGYQTEDSFVENSGGDLNQYQYVTLTLYFANETGDKLVRETRSVAYNTGKPLERVVVEQLISGPENAGHTRVLAADTNILNVTSSEKIAYVNFDKTFAESQLPAAEDVTIYAIVNSIIENCKDEKVMFSVDGQSDYMYRDKIDLSDFFEEDNSLLEESQ